MDVDDHDEVPQLEHGMNVNVGSQPSQPADVNFVDTDIPQDSSRGVTSLPENIKAAPNQQARPETQQHPSLCETTPKATSEDEFFQDDIPIDADTFSYFASLSKLAETRTESLLPNNSMDVEMAVEEDGGHVAVIDSTALQSDEGEEDEDGRRKDNATVRRSKRKRASSVITAPVKVATASRQTPSSSTRSSKRLRLTNESTSISAPLPRSSKPTKRGRPSAGASVTPAAPDVNMSIPEFRQWWVSLQPEWRVLNADKSELVKEMNEKDDSGSFDELRLPGKNGVVSVLAALYYWGLAVKGKNPKSKARQKWLEAVEDCHWIFEQLVRHSV
ncbi:hypothetical protein CPB84DRAFT_568052 [Gymnopilus junonius]|uniref:Uncharacterized protein n=1 Tax=Gymnopilus junonius TaxID=109634 RepID=A0A9P5NT89_GYMJU|nr:hypothetical protein CPB84DRAFT_568052 [Gymnopilus junonius]